METEIKAEYLNVIELSKYLSIKPKMIYALVESGQIPHYRIGRLIRFRKDEIDSWMEGNRGGHGQGEASSKYSKRAGRPGRMQITDIDRLIRKNIDRFKNREYTASHGKSDQIKGLGKEV